MKISERFNLGKTQAELDFIDIDTDRDIPLFLDPFFIGKRKDRWSVEATLTIKSFFQQIIDLIRANQIDDAKILFEYLHEDNATCLGMSTGRPEGNGVGDGDAINIFDNLIRSRAIQTGLIQDIEDNILFVEKFGKDKLSDMTTNIIKYHLLEYTKSQCTLHNIPLNRDVPSGYYWSRQNQIWETDHTDRLVINEKPILLVPKGAVSFCKAYTSDKYYNHFVLNFLQNEHLHLNSALVKARKNGSRFVTKKELKENNPFSKGFLRAFTTRHPEVLEEFKSITKVDSLKNYEITETDLRAICTLLGQRLLAIPPGRPNASDFHNIIIGILEMLFYPTLINPVKEFEILEGRKRIDISFDNGAQDGIFYRLSEVFQLPCPFIFMECKNYTDDPDNPALDQLSGRFSVNRGKVGFLICRTLANRDLFIDRCRDTFRDGRGLIIPLADRDIINLLDNHNEANDTFIDRYLSDIVRDIAGN